MGHVRRSELLSNGVTRTTVLEDDGSMERGCWCAEVQMERWEMEGRNWLVKKMWMKLSHVVLTRSGRIGMDGGSIRRRWVSYRATAEARPGHLCPEKDHIIVLGLESKSKNIYSDVRMHHFKAFKRLKKIRT